MAEINVIYAKVEAPVKEVHMILSPEEADFLYSLVGTGLIGSGRLRDLGRDLYYNFKEATGQGCKYRFIETVNVADYKVQRNG